MMDFTGIITSVNTSDPAGGRRCLSSYRVILSSRQDHYIHGWRQKALALCPPYSYYSTTTTITKRSVDRSVSYSGWAYTVLLGDKVQ